MLSLISFLDQNITNVGNSSAATETLVSCGTLGNFSTTWPHVISTIVTIIKIGIPILLIIFGMLDLGKAVVASKEDEIKKGQQTFFKRVIAAILVFFVVAIVQLLIKFINDPDSSTITSCMDCFLNNNCSPAKAE